VLKLAAGAICGMAAGAVSGIAARAAMRMVADGVVDPMMTLPSFTAAGTLAIVVSGMLAGAPFGALFAAVRDTLPGPRRARGLFFGIAMLVTLGPLFFEGARDEFITRERMVLFSVLFLLFGIAAGLVYEPSLRIARRVPKPAQAVLAFIAVGGGLVMIPIVLASVGSAISTHGALAIAYAVPWVATVLLVGLALRSRRPLAAA
jgi:hypothetical protein